MRLRLVPQETNIDFFRWARLTFGASIVAMVLSRRPQPQQKRYTLPLAYMIAVKRTSLLFGMLYGAWLFSEAGLGKNLAAGLLMIAGVYLIVG